MEHHTSHFLNLLERRLELLNRLAGDLSACSAAIVNLDLEGIHTRVGEQEKVCAQIRGLDAEIEALPMACRRDPGVPDEDARIACALEQVSAAQLEVRRLNQVHASLLCRSRRTLGALKNYIAAFAPTYLSPQSNLPSSSTDLGRA